jgi:hypothetical protein
LDFPFLADRDPLTPQGFSYPARWHLPLTRTPPCLAFFTDCACYLFWR